MEDILRFFADMPTWQKAAWVGACISVNLVFESIIPFKKDSFKKFKHDLVNIFFLIPIFIINAIFGIFTGLIYTLFNGESFGLLSLVELPIWLEIVSVLLFFDLVGQYMIHYFLHKFKWMWKLHMTHHSDTNVDVTSATRLHPGDYLLREVGALVVILITGAPFAYYMIYRISTVFFTYFTHANISLPKNLDKVLSYLIITPNVHKFHHHFERPWTDTNFGNMFSIWDRLFGTFVYEDPDKIIYGLDVVDETKDEDIGYQLKLPFNSDIKTDY